MDFHLEVSAGIGETKLVGQRVDPCLPINQETLLDEVTQGDTGLERVTQVFVEVGPDMGTFEDTEGSSDLQ